MKGMYGFFYIWCFIIGFYSTSVLSEEDSTTEYYDAVVIEAASDPLSERTGREVDLNSPELQPEDLTSQDSVPSYPLFTGPCFTSKGALGRCMSFRQCYPYFKVPEVNNWDSWVLGMYDTCSYFTAQGRQMFGVCCTAPAITTTSEPLMESSETAFPVSENSTSEDINDKNPENAKVPAQQPPVWPPPLPTHPPHHTIPPLPTHPPSPQFPAIYPAPTPAIPLPLPTTKPPGKPPAKPPTRPPTVAPPSWPKPTPANPSPTHDSSCGAKNGYQDQERIVGGHNADLGEWPWIAGLFNAGRQFCGGSLIDDIHILSAAHCVAHMSSWDVARLTVRLGDHNIRTNAEVQHIEKKVKRVVRHRGFDSRTLYNDVSILTLESPVRFSHQVRPICLPASTGETYAGRTATVIGWGSIRESGPQPSVLQEVSIPIWSNTECRLKYGGAAPGGIVEHMLCAGQASRDSCSGDSGGPLMVNTGRWTQVGIVSWGIGCGKGQYPGVYARVQSFLPWIHKNLK